jgi:hypothetical protein
VPLLELALIMGIERYAQKLCVRIFGASQKAKNFLRKTLMGRTLYKCSRCGKRLKVGNERFIGTSAYGPACYEIMRQKRLEFEMLVMRKAKHG